LQLPASKGAKWADVDFRNPCLSIDFGTTLDGRITSDDLPYAKTIGNFCGYAGAIPDAIIKGTRTVDVILGTALDVFDEKSTDVLTLKLKGKMIRERKSSKKQYKIWKRACKSKSCRSDGGCPCWL
jgi:hypothetical protein